MKLHFVPFLLGVSAIAASMQANAAQEFIVTTGPAGIFVLNVNNTSYVKTVPGDPFVPTPLPGTALAEDQPLLFGSDPTGEYLYADYNTCLVPPGNCNIASNELFSFKMVNGIPYQISRVLNYNARECAGCPALLNSIVVTAHYVFVMAIPWMREVAIYSTINGVLAQVGYLPMANATVLNPLSLQVDAADHFAYLNYNDDSSYVNPVADHVAIFDLTPLPSHPPRLITTKPQVGGILVGVQ
jgi:hypothetical protein